MNPSVPRGLAPALALALGCGGLVGCKAKRTSAPKDFADAGIDDLERMLAANEQQLAQVGVSLTPAPAQTEVDSSETKTSSAPVESDSPPPSYADDEAEDAAAPEPEPEREPRPESMSEARATARQRKDARRVKAERCSTICDLASSTCGLEQQICRLANDHQDETRYRDSCERAELDCEVSAEACRDCTE